MMKNIKARLMYAQSLFHCFLVTAVLCLLPLYGCGGDDANEDNNTPVGDEDEPVEAEPQAVDYESPGPYFVGNVHITLTDTTRDRELLVEIWYPAAQSAKLDQEAGQPIENFVPAGEDRDQYVAWLDAAPAVGPTRIVHSALEGEPNTDGAPWPVIMYSHCMNCTRFAACSIAERLASHGFAVVAPEHTGGTMFEPDAPMAQAFLETRGADIQFALDSVLDADNEAIPEYLRGQFDGTRVGMYGHSFGSSTTGWVLENEPRVLAGFAIAAPFDIGFDTDVKAIHKPIFFLIAKEDHMISFIGSDYIRDNYNDANPPAWKAEVIDAGHMSFSDICWVQESMVDGCSEAERQEPPYEPFTYIDIELGKSIGQAYAAAFFSATILDEPSAKTYLEEAHPEEWVEMEFKK